MFEGADVTSMSYKRQLVLCCNFMATLLILPSGPSDGLKFVVRQSLVSGLIADEITRPEVSRYVKLLTNNDDTADEAHEIAVTVLNRIKSKGVDYNG